MNRETDKKIREEIAKLQSLLSVMHANWEGNDELRKRRRDHIWL
jgi:hypothetical protein